MHVFLTGAPGVGKSTILNRAIDEYHITPGGFRTIGESVPQGMPSYVSLFPCANKEMSGAKVAYRSGVGWRFEAYPEVFDTVGVAALTDRGGAELILMDELGFMEREAYLFQNKVLELLDGELPILGVIKERDEERNIPFLDRVREHKNVVIWTVNMINRGQVEEKVKSWLMKNWKFQL